MNLNRIFCSSFAKELLIQTYKKIQIENESLFEKRQQAFLKEIEVNRLNASIDYILTSAKLLKPLLIITKDNEVISITEDGLSSHKNVL